MNNNYFVVIIIVVIVIGIVTMAVIIVMMIVMMIVTIISVIIIWPAVSDSDIYNRCDIPAAIVVRDYNPSNMRSRNKDRTIPELYA